MTLRTEITYLCEVYEQEPKRLKRLYSASKKRGNLRYNFERWIEYLPEDITPFVVLVTEKESKIKHKPVPLSAFLKNNCWHELLAGKTY